ncbi:ABC-2 family transporter protein [Streptomyces sp. TRM 70361]|uniref:ABC transporter permease n=1 Tax=Streptomyces sp. TRM 70361 TaxID=3116553 RepID=UPI002E7B52A8|nr:ABC-2 family transporter protein [Streptomyces sp. TRM 70361]MEE1942158.1 ABC-2 family transporter protein [Streptomyces sp. TRM 70361]
MTALAPDPPPAPVPSRRAWRAARITPLGELNSPPRLTATAVRLVVQVFLVVFLWRGLYAQTDGSVAGLDREQAVAYAVLAVLATRVRDLNRHLGRDTVQQHLHFGTIAYWFLRPLPPHRYHALRALGDQLYGFAWVIAGYLVCRAAGVLPPPASAAAAAAFAAGVLLGQTVLYFVMTLTDLLCFWTLRDDAALQIVQFAQNLLSGSFAPLWFFPGWFRTMSDLLPFQATLNTPLSLYIGRIPPAEAPRALLVQVMWVVVLAALTRWLWHRAALRVVSQGG